MKYSLDFLLGYKLRSLHDKNHIQFENEIETRNMEIKK